MSIKIVKILNTLSKANAKRRRWEFSGDKHSRVLDLRHMDRLEEGIREFSRQQTSRALSKVHNHFSQVYKK